jgi:acyl-CoA thioester hydrolase
MELSETLDFEVRFSEVDSMNVVWHGSYPLYFEDAREAFGRKYDLGYQKIFKHGFFAPIVELNFQYKRPIVYGMHPAIKIVYVPTDAAKLIFDYEVFNRADGAVITTGHSVQVFTDTHYQLQWFPPKFYEEWKKRWLTE